jgi:hypothetical protein
MIQGFIVSDWEAQHAGVATVLAGLDMVMPNGDKFWGEILLLQSVMALCPSIALRIWLPGS